jgi:hypothetical protein
MFAVAMAAKETVLVIVLTKTALPDVHHAGPVAAIVRAIAGQNVQ